MSVEFCQDYFGFSDDELGLIQGRSGVKFLTDLFERGELYESRYNILRQELYWAAGDARCTTAFLADFPDCASLLDYGCGAAPYMQKFIDAGHQIYLYEPSDVARGYIAEKHKADDEVFICEALRDVARRRYDRIMCLDVLEHVGDPRDLADELVGYLAPDGELLIYFSTRYPHPGHLLEAIEQFDDVMRDLSQRLRLKNRTEDWCLTWWRNDE